MTRSTGVHHALCQAVLVGFTVLDLVTGSEHVLLCHLVIAPLVAATGLGRTATVGYGVLALVAGALLGIHHQLYSGVALLAQLVRLSGIALGTAVAVVACTLRLRREAALARMSDQAAADRAVVQLAEALQRNLLGRPPPLPNLETAVRYLPASRHTRVGGDWYDAFPVEEGRIVLVIGDVAGHDVPAATTMAQVRGMLRGAAHAGGVSPATVLGVLDRALASLGMTSLVTAAVAILEPGRAGTGQARLRWSNAGHPAPVLVHADGRTEVLERRPDRLLGVSADTERRDHEQPLTSGDTVLLYTDGLVERRSATLDHGTACLVRELQRLGRAPLEQLCDGLLALADGRGDDDIALLAVRLRR
jgi:sigma-B regulation protein RsbU (phosphoserine phosphatase)